MDGRAAAFDRAPFLLLFIKHLVKSFSQLMVKLSIYICFVLAEMERQEILFSISRESCDP